MPSSAELTWLGHATVLIETGGARLLTDPVLRERVAHLRRHAPAPVVPDELDAVLLSHLHRDHADAPSLRRVATRGPIVVPRGAGAAVRRMVGRGARDAVTELGAGESLEVAPGVVVHAVPAVHDGRRSPLARDRPDALGYVVDAGPRVYFAGDTALYDAMPEEVGPIDAALLPIWGWGTTLGAGHMDPRDAARAAGLLRPTLAIPIHWGTFLPLGTRRGHPALAAPADDFARHAAELAPGVEVRVIAPGSGVRVA